MDVTHQGRDNASRKELQQIIATTYKVNDPNTVFVFGFKTQFGGGKSTGFGLIYDNLAAAKKFEPKHRLVRVCSLVYFQYFICIMYGTRLLSYAHTLARGIITYGWWKPFIFIYIFMRFSPSFFSFSLFPSPITSNFLVIRSP